MENAKYILKASYEFKSLFLKQGVQIHISTFENRGINSQIVHLILCHKIYKCGIMILRDKIKGGEINDGLRIARR